MHTVEYSPITEEDLDLVLAFTDKWIGKNYYQKEELAQIIQQGHKCNLNASVKACVGGELAGIRLTLAPGSWIKETSEGLSLSKWNIPEGDVAYFKSLFVSEKFQKLGIGKELSKRSIDILKKMNAAGILCHSWLESPGNSSQKYLLSMGFKEVRQHQKFWSQIDYLCTRCSPKKCACTAAEMLKLL
ncbi:GNAT family N-acetyltransferase [Halobacteriovorax sp. HLS]|uniref:GNAT family N-acetyltransferase n=1 Tax=Halobacteriovorax sp. HLS TaxID=2234000 RepID=UPI0013E38B7B|nr:GNAT family N-acetyltransferase [Halobacteriovorax sp. HLS]